MSKARRWSERVTTDKFEEECSETTARELEKLEQLLLDSPQLALSTTHMKEDIIRRKTLNKSDSDINKSTIYESPLDKVLEWRFPFMIGFVVILLSYLYATTIYDLQKRNILFSSTNTTEMYDYLTRKHSKNVLVDENGVDACTFRILKMSKLLQDQKQPISRRIAESDIIHQLYNNNLCNKALSDGSLTLLRTVFGEQLESQDIEFIVKYIQQYNNLPPRILSIHYNTQPHDINCHVVVKRKFTAPFTLVTRGIKSPTVAIKDTSSVFECREYDRSNRTWSACSPYNILKQEFKEPLVVMWGDEDVSVQVGGWSEHCTNE
ncbi:SFH5 [Acrasis kona]|uniref:SFH5 n=1 Tax=Acrasis kona TaxID=1008807 RepID=A0AAW2YH42_9EUKA